MIHPHLREDCLTALENYAREATKTCELLGEVELGRPSLEQLLAILAQAELERDLKELYVCVRQRLCEVLLNRIESFEPLPSRFLSGTSLDR